MIVEDGRAILADLIVDQAASHIAIGIGSKPEAVGDRALSFEIARAPINSRSYSPVESSAVFKATFPDWLTATITEVGLVRSSEDTTTTVELLSFEQASENWAGGSWVTTNKRYGSQGLYLTAATATATGLDVGLTQFVSDDQARLAYHGAGGNVTVRLRADDSNYLQYTFTAAAGFNVHEIALGEMSSVGAPDLASIREVQIVHAGSGGITLDALHVRRLPEPHLLNRKVLAAPIIKQAGAPLDIEVPLVMFQ